MAKALWLFSIWQEHRENGVSVSDMCIREGGNSIYANHMSFELQIESEALHI
jgi:hypothetical protein